MNDSANLFEKYKKHGPEMVGFYVMNFERAYFSIFDHLKKINEKVTYFANDDFSEQNKKQKCQDLIEFLKKTEQEKMQEMKDMQEQKKKIINEFTDYRRKRMMMLLHNHMDLNLVLQRNDIEKNPILQKQLSAIAEKLRRDMHFIDPTLYGFPTDENVGQKRKMPMS